MSERRFEQIPAFQALAAQVGVEASVYGSEGYQAHIWKYENGRYPNVKNPESNPDHAESLERAIGDFRFLINIAQALIGMVEADVLEFLASHPSGIRNELLPYLGNDVRRRYREAHPEPMYPAGGP